MLLRAESRAGPNVSLLELSVDRVALAVEGALPLGWLEQVTSNLAHRGVSVESLHGEHANDRWRATLACRGAPSDWTREDWRRRFLESHRVDLPIRRLLISSVHAAIDPSYDGCLLVHVGGRDDVGFLATLLRTLALHGLFPVQLQIETDRDVVEDNLWLKSYGGTRPPASAARRVEAALIALGR